MNLRVLLINPPVTKIVEPWYDTPDFVRPGLAYLAGYLREFLPCTIAIIDSKFERLNFDQTLQKAKEFSPHIVGITAFTNEIKPAAKVAEEIKLWNSAIWTVIGGVHVTALPKATLEEFQSFDLGVFGEGEITFTEVCRAILQNPKKPDFSEIDGLVIRNPQEITQNKNRERIFDLDLIPEPAWDLLPVAETYFVQVSRGCPFACKFCMNPNGKIARRRSIPGVLRELERLVNAFKPKEIWYGDEIFTVDMDFTKNLLRSKIASRLSEKIKWSAVTHVRFVDDELFELMAQSNVNLIGFGIETGDEEILKRIGKGTTLELIYKAREGARKYRVPITTYMILGQPNESRETIRKTIELAVQLNPELPIFGIMVPYPGTEVARLAARGEAGFRLISQDWDAYNKQVGGALEFAGLSRRQIEAMQIFAYFSVFLRNYRFFDLIKFIWKFKTAGLAVFGKILGRPRAMPLRGKSLNLVNEDPGFKKTMSRASADWQAWQTSELVRIKKISSGKQI